MVSILIRSFELKSEFSDKLPKERAANREKNQPLCMAQYYRLLGSCRRPGDPRDSQYLPEPRNDQHVIVSCRNQVHFIRALSYSKSSSMNCLFDLFGTDVLCAGESQ